jgi:hypothetical protein
MNNDTVHMWWPCGRDADRNPDTHTQWVRALLLAYIIAQVYVPKTTRDWLHPLKLRTWAELRDKRAPTQSASSGVLTSLDAYPVLDAKAAVHEFTIPFNKKCGADNQCETDLHMKCSFGNLA